MSEKEVEYISDPLEFYGKLLDPWAEIARLRAILAPLLDHAEAHDYAPPIRFSVMECREIKEKVDAAQNG